MIELIDEQVGRMLEALSRTGQRDNTVVIFMSDHGEMLGDHGLTAKGCRFYEGAVRVPLVISWPGPLPAGCGGRRPGGADRRGADAGRADRRAAAVDQRQIAAADPDRRRGPGAPPRPRTVRILRRPEHVPAPGAGPPHPLLGHHVPRRPPQAGHLPRPRLRRVVRPRTRSPGADQPVGGARRRRPTRQAHPEQLRRHGRRLRPRPRPNRAASEPARHSMDYPHHSGRLHGGDLRRPLLAAPAGDQPRGHHRPAGLPCGDR